MKYYLLSSTPSTPEERINALHKNPSLSVRHVEKTIGLWVASDRFVYAGLYGEYVAIQKDIYELPNVCAPILPEPVRASKHLRLVNERGYNSHNTYISMQSDEVGNILILPTNMVFAILDADTIAIPDMIAAHKEIEDVVFTDTLNEAVNVMLQYGVKAAPRKFGNIISVCNKTNKTKLNDSMYRKMWRYSAIYSCINKIPLSDRHG